MTTSKHWQQVESLFNAALFKQGDERRRFLYEACPSDATMRVEVEELLAVHERTGPLDRPINSLVATLVAEDKLSLVPGQIINQYHIIEFIGKGGMGVVYKAEDTMLGRTVAIKVFSKSASSKWSAKSQYVREARAGAAINHPNIVTIYEIGETSDITYIIMEYVEAQSLHELISSSSLDAEQILSISIQACHALAEVHSRRIVHRDVKPANVLVNQRGVVKLLDFGIARPFSGSVLQQTATFDPGSDAETDEVAGTIHYMSPEQIRGESLDERTDIFSFGVLLYEMITGRVPFAGNRIIEIAKSVLKEKPADFDPTSKRLPPQIRDVIMRCLEKDRERRFSSLHEIKDVLEELRRQSRPVTDRQPANTIEFSYSPATPAVPIILVLPFEVLGSGAEESLGVGLSYMISTNLARIRGLSLISKSAVEGQALPASDNKWELARRLGTTLLLEGEMMSLTDGYAIMARLIDIVTGHIIWGNQYFGGPSNFFKIQQVMSKEIAEALNVDMPPGDQEPVAHLSTENIGALELYSKARALLDRYDLKENIDEAIGLLEEAVKSYPKFALAFTALSDAYWHKYLLTVEESWMKMAIAACDRALILDPQQSEVHISLATIYYNTERVEQAIESFKRAIDLQPASDRALRGIGWCYHKKGDIETAVSYLEKAIAARPGCWYYYNDLGKCYYSFGAYDKAAEQFRRVIAVQPDTYNGYNNLGVTYCLLGLYEDAIAMHRRAIEIHPSEEAYSNLGTEYFCLGRYEEAAQEYHRAIDLFPGQDILHFNLGEAYVQLGRDEEALQQFEHARRLLADRLKVKRGDGLLYGQMALYLAKLGRHDEARSHITTALSLEPLNPWLIFQQAVIFAIAKDLERAIEYLRAAIEHGFSKTEAAHDPNLKSLFQDERVKSLLDLQAP
jgi:serine/threonine protein kinase/tetratricopeptide (TPR) repeat protein